MKTAIFDIENWREIGATLSRNKTRTFLTAFGIFWGTAMLALLIGGESGFERKLKSNFDGFATNSAVVNAFRRTISYQGYNKGSSWYLTTQDVANFRQALPEVEAIAETGSRYGISVTDGTTAVSTSVQGVSPEFSSIFLPVIYDGRFINEADEASSAKVCVIGKQISEKIYGTDSPVGRYISIDGIYYRIVGVAGQTGEVSIGSKIDECMTIPMSTMRRAFNMGDMIDDVVLLFRDGVKPANVKARIERMVGRLHRIHPDDHNAMSFFDISEMFEMVDKLFAGITLLAIFVGVSSLVAGIIGVGNIMWVIVKERTQEIGIRRAIGARPSDIVTQILSEGMLLTLVAGTSGIVFATLILFAASKLIGPGFELGFYTAVGIMLTFMVLGTLAGMIPAFKAMKIKPVEAINDK